MPATCNSVCSYGLFRAFQLLRVLIEQRAESDDVSLLRSVESWPSTDSESMCALSASPARVTHTSLRDPNCASASFASRFAFRSSSRGALGFFAEPNRCWERPAAARGWTQTRGPVRTRDLHSLERVQPFHPPLPAVWARHRRLFEKRRGRVEPFTRTVGRPRGTWLNASPGPPVRQEVRSPRRSLSYWRNLVEEWDGYGHHRRRVEHCVVGQAGKNCEPRLRTSRPVPPCIALSAAEQREHLDRV